MEGRPSAVAVDPSACCCSLIPPRGCADDSWPDPANVQHAAGNTIAENPSCGQRRGHSLMLSFMRRVEGFATGSGHFCVDASPQIRGLGVMPATAGRSLCPQIKATSASSVRRSSGPTCRTASDERASDMGGMNRPSAEEQATEASKTRTNSEPRLNEFWYQHRRVSIVQTWRPADGLDTVPPMESDNQHTALSQTCTRTMRRRNVKLEPPD